MISWSFSFQGALMTSFTLSARYYAKTGGFITIVMPMKDDAHCVCCDPYMELWDTIEQNAPRSEWNNNNRKF
jgi:hypothetical protein